MFYLGIQRDAHSYERKIYGLVEFITEAGGFLAFSYRVSVALVAVLCYTNVNSKLMYLIYKKKLDLSHRDLQTKSNIREI